jgi:hypothetical protein
MDILEFNIGKQRLSLIDKPPILNFLIYPTQTIQGDDGGVGITVLSYPRLQICYSKVDFDEVASWVMTI